MTEVSSQLTILLLGGLTLRREDGAHVDLPPQQTGALLAPFWRLRGEDCE